VRWRDVESPPIEWERGARMKVVGRGGRRVGSVVVVIGELREERDFFWSY